MLHKVIELHEQGSKNSFVTTYLLESNPEMQLKKRPVVIVCPGGGYSSVSYREGEPIALQFLAKGYHAMLLNYSVAPNATYPTALLELGRVVYMLRQNANQWHIDTDRIMIIGFSAGGHLAASYSCFWSKNFISQALGCNIEDLKPNGLLLGYPVITSGKYICKRAFEDLLGDRYEELVESMSLENQVTSDNPPTFIWHTIFDELVPVEHSILFAKALKDHNIPLELNIYPEGKHGLALANSVTALDESQVVPSCQNWVDLAQKWIVSTFGDFGIGN